MVISVQCPSCSTSFPVDPAKVPEGGVNARCSTCSAVFRVERPATEEARPTQGFEAPVEAMPPVEAIPPVEATPPPERDVPRPPEELEQPEEEESIGIEVTVEQPFFGEEPTVEAAQEIEPAPEAAEPEPPTVETARAEEPALEAAEPEEPTPVAPETPEAVAEVTGSEEPESPAIPPTDDWVIEREEEIGPSDLTVEPMDTVESSLEEARDEDEALFGDPFGLEMSETTLEPLEEDVRPEPTAPAEPVMPASAPDESPPEPEAPAPKTQGFTFGHRDPHDKARRLARVLVSDMIMYNPDRHRRALAGGTLKEDFEDEISKSWKEYVDQVGDEIASGTSYWSDALNDVLAKGEQIF